MNEVNYKLTKINTKNKQYVRASQPIWDDGIKVGEKNGFIEIKVETDEEAERRLARFTSGELTVSFGSEILINGIAQGIYNIEVSKAAVVSATELEHA